MMKAKDLAKSASLIATESRVEKAIASRDLQKNKSTTLIKFGGVEAATGKAFGTRQDGSIIYFALETNAVPAIGSTLEVAIANKTLFGKGDSRPVK